MCNSKTAKIVHFFVQFCHFEAGLSVNQPKFSCRLFFVQFAPLKFLENVYYKDCPAGVYFVLEISEKLCEKHSIE